MRLLGVFRLVLIHPWGFWQEVFAKSCADCVAGGHHRLGGHVDPVCSHIGDMPRLIEALCRAHGLARAHAKFAAGLLLQGRGHKGRAWIAGGRFRLDTGHSERAACHRTNRHLGRGLRGQVEFIQLLATKMGQTRLKGLSTRCHKARAH